MRPVRATAVLVVTALAMGCGGGGFPGTPDLPGTGDPGRLEIPADGEAGDGEPRPDRPPPDPTADVDREADAAADPETGDDGYPDGPRGSGDDATTVEPGTEAVETPDPDAGGDPPDDLPNDGAAADTGPEVPLPDVPPVDAGILVNAIREGDQSQPSVAPRKGGGWWVAWQTRAPSGGDWQVAARCLAPDGTPASEEVRVSSEDCLAARRPSVAVTDDGSLWVAYEADGLDGDGSAVALRRLASCDADAGPEWRLNAFTSSFQGAPALAPLPGGTVVAAWQSECRVSSSCAWLDGSWAAVAHRRANDDGPIGLGESVVNRFTVGDQFQPSVAAMPGGGWWVAWAGATDVSSIYDVFLDRFDADGLRQGEDLPVNGSVAGPQSMPRICALAGGGAAVAWMDWDPAGTAMDLRARLLDPSGQPRSADLPLAADPEGLESSVALAPAGDGFRAAWRHRGSSSSPGTVRWRVFDADGNPAGPERIASEDRDGDSGQPALAAAADGRTLLVFTSSARDGSGTAIVAVTLP